MRKPVRAFALVYAVALTVRLFLLFGLERYEIGRPEPVRIALALARTGSFADPYAIPTGPTAHTAPFYPALIAPVYRILGDTPTADRARFAVNACATSAEYALLPALSVAFGMGLWPGLLAGLAGALIPLHYWPECMGDFETTWVAVFLELAVLVFLRFLRAPRLDMRAAFLGGVFWGAGFLISPNVLPVLLALSFIALWKIRPHPRVALRWTAAFSAAALLVLAPWLARNATQLGGLFFVRDNFGLELAVSNHDAATPYAEQNYTVREWREIHPHTGRAAAQHLAQIGELAFEREQLHTALHWISAHPARFGSLTAARTLAFWFPRTPRFEWALWIVTIAALAGLGLLAREHRFAALVFASVLVSYSAIYCLLQNTLRYQHPIWWAFLLLWGWLGTRATLNVAVSLGCGNLKYPRGGLGQ